jgi:hypothetical protein
MRIQHTLLCSLLTLATSLGHPGDSSLIRGPLENAGIDADASGTVRSAFTCRNTDLDVKLSGLTPGAPYQFIVAGTAEADFVGDAKGRASLRFRLEPDANEFALDFDPRGQELAVTDGTSNVLMMVYSGEGEPDALVVDERTTLARAEGVLSGRVVARYLDQKRKTRFVLHLLGLDRGAYTLRVDGVDEAEVDLSKGRSALVVFEAHSFKGLKSAKHGGHPGNGNGRKNKHELDFDPRGKLVELVKDETVAFSGVMLAQIEELPSEEGEVDEVIVPLDSAGIDEDATGSATIATDATGKTTFTVALDWLPVGTYELVIGETPRGNIVVKDEATDDTHGKLVYSTAPTGTELLLNFDPSGSIQIRQGELVFFSGELP